LPKSLGTHTHGRGKVVTPCPPVAGSGCPSARLHIGDIEGLKDQQLDIDALPGRQADQLDQFSLARMAFLSIGCRSSFGMVASFGDRRNPAGATRRGRLAIRPLPVRRPCGRRGSTRARVSCPAAQLARHRWSAARGCATFQTQSKGGA
jgi:hypothetical protein